MAAAVVNHTPPKVSGADGRQAQRLAGLLLASAQQNAVLPALDEADTLPGETLKTFLVTNTGPAALDKVDTGGKPDVGA